MLFASSVSKVLKKAITPNIHRKNFCNLLKVHKNREGFVSCNICRLWYFKIEIFICNDLPRGVQFVIRSMKLDCRFLVTSHMQVSLHGYFHCMEL